MRPDTTQLGECLLNGENCTLVETALENLSDSGSVGSLTDITLQPPHKFNVAVSARSALVSYIPVYSVSRWADECGGCAQLLQWVRRTGDFLH